MRVLIFILLPFILPAQVTYNTFSFCEYDKYNNFECQPPVHQSTTFIDVHTKTGYKMLIKQGSGPTAEEFKSDITSVDFLRDESNRIYGKIFHITDFEVESTLIVNEKEEYAVYVFTRNKRTIYVVYKNIH
jgi:hypothetical protein